MIRLVVISFKLVLEGRQEYWQELQQQLANALQQAQNLQLYGRGYRRSIELVIES